MVDIGFIFENLCIKDLSAYTSHDGGIISYYGDKLDLKVQCVIHLRNGDYTIIEFKLGMSEEDISVRNLFKMIELIKKNNMKEPNFLAVITGGKYAYTRKEGLKVIPIVCLR